MLSRRRFLQIAAVGLPGLTFASSACMTGCFKPKTSLRQFTMQSPWVNDAEFIGYFVALEKGWYPEAGLDLTYKPGGPDVIAEGTLVAKKADIALTPIETTVNLIIKDHAPLKIVGTQYQKSPLGIVSLKKNGINEPKDLIGKRLAVPSANVLTVQALLKLNQIPVEKVKIVPYQYDPTPLIKGEVDATVDFVTNVPYAIEQAGVAASSFLMYDFGLVLFNDAVVTLDETLNNRRDDVVKWLSASRKGWEENFKDTSKYPAMFAASYFQGTGRTVANENFFNNAQKSLIEAKNGIFSMTEEAIEGNIRTLQQIGLKASREMFVTELAKAL